MVDTLDICGEYSDCNPGQQGGAIGGQSSGAISGGGTNVRVG